MKCARKLVQSEYDIGGTSWFWCRHLRCVQSSHYACIIYITRCWSMRGQATHELPLILIRRLDCKGVLLLVMTLPVGVV